MAGVGGRGLPWLPWLGAAGLALTAFSCLFPMHTATGQNSEGCPGFVFPEPCGPERTWGTSLGWPAGVLAGLLSLGIVSLPRRPGWRLSVWFVGTLLLGLLGLVFSGGITFAFSLRPAGSFTAAFYTFWLGIGLALVTGVFEFVRETRRGADGTPKAGVGASYEGKDGRLHYDVEAAKAEQGPQDHG